MIYRVKFEDHYDEEWYYEHECLIKVSDPSEIEKRLKSNYSPKGYIKILSIDEFVLYDGEMLDITRYYGASA